MNKIIAILLVFIGTSLTAQNNFFQQHSISISVYQHSIGFSLKKPLNVGFSVGTEFLYKKKEISSWHQKVEVGWHYHKNLSSALWVKTDFVQRFTTNSGFVSDIQLGIGYLHEFEVYQTFQHDGNGSFEEVRNMGRPQFIASMGVGIGYQYQLKNNTLITPFIRYESMLQLPHSQLTTVLPQSLLQLGSRFNFQKK